MRACAEGKGAVKVDGWGVRWDGKCADLVPYKQIYDGPGECRRGERERARVDGWGVRQGRCADLVEVCDTLSEEL